MAADRPEPSRIQGPCPAGAGAARSPRARSARGRCLAAGYPQPRRCAPPFWHRGCRAPARRVHGRRVRYAIGDEPGQVNGMRWRPGTAP
ncbi:tryptophan biosynthesis modulator TrpM [Streptomyces sp. NPDC052042]|uniref:tryptophan biosynthesis modulator TrpM n=1 Tax=Streptomyces sp. NPDC052042 TaxID=3365683 RepID=UPI0037D3DCBC